MKTMKLKGLFLCLVFLLCNATSHAADDLITRQITIKLDKAGTLPDKIGSSKKYKITNLKIVGEINGTDWRLIRDMAGRGFYNLIDLETDGKLSILDLSEAKIVYSKDRYDTHGSHTETNAIGEYAFSGCSGLTSITLPSGIFFIEECAFYGCSGLTSITLPSGVTSIRESAFENCSGLTSITLPSGVTLIRKSVFSGCRGLTSITLPSGVTSIGESAFKGCGGLTSLTIHSDVTEISSSAFWGCTGLKDVSFYINGDFETYLTKNHPYIDVNCGIEYYLNGKKITSVVIPSTITTLGRYAFKNCRDLTSVTVSWQSPISAGSAFYGVDRSKCTLYVPQGTEQDYWLADVWGDFGNIVEYDPTGIDKTTTSTDAKELSRYSVNGQRLSAPAKGLNILKYSDGSVKKVVVQ